MLIAVWGASPGIGKSTLCARLAEWLAGSGLRVDHFREEEILTRPQFAAVASEFQATGIIEPATLLTATGQFVDSIRSRGDDVVVADALVPFLPTLLATGHGQESINSFMAGLREILAPLCLAMIFLDGEAATALSRAAAREGPAWLDWYIGKLARYKVKPEVNDLASAAEYLRHERAMTLSAAERHGWHLILIDRATEQTPDQVLQAAQRALAPWIRRDVQ